MTQQQAQQTPTTATNDAWPTDTDDAFYVLASSTMALLLERAQQKWPDEQIAMDALTISAKYIHLYCLSYDRYDASDWALFLRIERGTDE